jgi:putative nucleotidyltransferase with HDIG domain
MIARQLAIAIHREQLLLDQKKYARALKALSACNEVMMYASNEDELLREVCKVIVREEGYLGAWVAYKGEDVYQSLTPRAVAGVDLESLLLVEYTWNVNDPKCGMMPPGQAVRSGQPAIVRDVDHEKECECCRLLAKDVGFQSVLALPLVFENELSGVLTIYAAGVNAFGEQEILQLNNMARNLVYGIVSLRMRTEKQNAMKALRRSEHNLRNVINHEADGVMVLDDDNTIKFVNPALEKLLGKNSKELVGTDFGFPLTSDESSQIELINQASMPTQCEMRMTEADWEEKPARIVTMHDLSERIRLEQEREEHAKRQQLMLVETITAMSNAMASRDPYTAAHMERVSGLSVAIAEQLELEADRIEGIRLGGIIHDIGKLYVPAEILNRPGRLSPAEFDIIRSHAQVGYDIIKGVPFTWPVAEMVYQHHERIDGSGYPNGLKGDEITLEARILAVADVVEAMSSHRPYRPSLGMQPAIEEIRKNRGVYYDAEVVDACIEVVNSGGFQL